MSEWCQNKKCPQKKTQSQIRGNKGNKYYQSIKLNIITLVCFVVKDVWTNGFK